jgi:hypothetical protein
MLTPTGDAAPVDILLNYKGLNDQNDSIVRPKGTVTSSINVWDEQAGDANRRHGRTFDSLQSGQIGLLAQISWGDGSSVTIFNNGSNLKFDPFVFPDHQNGNITASLSNPNTPGPMPNAPTGIIPFFKNSSTTIPDFTSFIRALSQASIFVNSGIDNTVVPDQIYGIDFYRVDISGSTLITSNVRDKATAIQYLSQGLKPVPNLSYGPVTPEGLTVPDDFYWVDYFSEGNPRISSNLNTIRNSYNGAITSYIKTNPIEGSTAIQNYSNGFPDDRDLIEVTNLNWPVRAPIIAENINKLTRVGPAGVSEVNGVGRGVGAGFLLDFGFGLPTDTCPLVSGTVTTKFPATAFDGFETVYNGPGTIVFSTHPIAIGGASYFGDIISDGIGFGADIVAVTMQLQVDLTQYDPAFVGSSTPTIYMILNGIGSDGFGTNPPPIGQTTTSKYGLWPEGGPQLVPGQISTTGFITGTLTNNPSLPACFPLSNDGRSVGWSTLNSASRCLLTRDNPIQAIFSSGGGSSAPAVITPDEFFGLQASPIQVATTAETFISWGKVKTSFSGGAARSYPGPTPLGGPVNITPSTTVLYSSDSQGFDPNRFLGATYRPTILLILELSSTISSGVPTNLTIRLYINGNLVETIAGFSVFGGVINWAFSIKDVGQFTNFRPPNNDVANNLAGWPNPNVKVSVQTDAGSVTINNASTRLVDYVLQYPV